MNIPFYQTEWHGINLVELANKIKHPLPSLPDAKFYDAFYQRLLMNKGPSEEWKNSKKHVTHWLSKMLTQLELSDKRILSIGAGTGVVESPLIDKGFKIDLHDIQENSFATTEINKKTTCYVGELSGVPQKYDALVSIAACYTLSDSQMNTFFSSCANLLKENGVFIILDTSLSWYEIYSYIRNRQHLANNCLLWGKKRSINSIFNHSKKSFLLRHFDFYDDKISNLNVIKFLNVPINVTPTWQSLVFEKK